MNRKRTLTLLLAGALTLAAAGCGKTEDTDTTESASGTGSVTTEPVSATSEKKEDKKKAKAAITDTSYADKIFDTSYVHEINIEISEEDWADLKANPTAKTKYKTNVTIDGETLNEVSFATKGNTSLSSVASDPDSDRYSFKLNFGKYVDDQTYYGMQKLNLNNLYADATYMKDYLSYQIFRAAGADASLASYVHLSVNGESFGLYLAVEEVDESFLARNTDGEGDLYKPESEALDNMGKMGNGQMPEGMTLPDGTNFPGNGEMPEGMTPPDGANFPQNGQMPEGMTPPDGANFPGNGEMPEGMTPPDGANFPQNGQMPEGMTPPDGANFPQNGQMPETDQSSSDDTDTTGQKDRKDSKGRGGKGGFGGQGGFGGFGNSNSGASLVYTDDKIDSYSDIFENAETDATEEDEKRVISALKQLSEGTDPESCLDTDSVIRYFAAHNFVINYDSYTGTMLHNYYLYENDGKLSMIPWDYNLAFGGFGGGGGDRMPTAGNNENKENGDTAATPDPEASSMPGGDDATSLINTGIDTPLSGSTTDSRPMWAWIANNEEYLQKYHEVYDELLKNYFENGACAAEIDRVYNMIKPYVEKDASAFYTADEFTKAYETLKSFCSLRSESIRKQLDGTLSASTTDQKSEDQVDGSGLNVKDMGSQGGGKDGMGGMNFGPGGNGGKNKDSKDKTTEAATEP